MCFAPKKKEQRDMLNHGLAKVMCYSASVQMSTTMFMLQKWMHAVHSCCYSADRKNGCLHNILTDHCFVQAIPQSNILTVAHIY